MKLTAALLDKITPGNVDAPDKKATSRVAKEMFKPARTFEETAARTT